MATEIVASTDELLEKKVDEEVNGQKSVSLSNEHDKDGDAQGSAASFSKTEGDENKDEPAVVVVENIDDYLSSKASYADNLKEEKELIHDSQTISVTEPAPHTESTETREEKQPNTVEIIGELNKTAEANLLKESEVELVKETENLETSSQNVDKPEPAVTEVQENSENPEKESQEAEQLNTVVVSDPSAETDEKPCVAKESTEPIIQQVHGNSGDQEKESQENTQEVQQPTTVATFAPSAETNEKLSDAMEKPEPIVTKVHEKSEEAEKESQENPHEPKTDLKQETEYSAPFSIEEKVAANDDNKQQAIPIASEGSSREAEVEIKKDDRPTADKEKQGHPETKVEIRETLESKLGEKVQDEAELPTKENDASEDLPPMETPAKPVQKQSNNIMSKVKKLLIKAKKAITGKSPTTSKTISSQAKGDIIVK